MEAKIFKILTLGFIKTNCYILSGDGKSAVIIDPAENEIKISAGLKKLNLIPSAVLLTHGHFDHTGAAAALQKKGVKIYMNEADKETLSFRMALFKSPAFIPDYYLSDGQILNLCGLEFKVIFTPGHTPGGTCYLLGDTLFSGDTLFCGDIGRTDLKGGDRNALINSIKTKLYTLDDSVSVYPGHEESTTIGREKRFNADVRAD